jgi:hypothetical protein
MRVVERVSRTTGAPRRRRKRRRERRSRLYLEIATARSFQHECGFGADRDAQSAARPTNTDVISWETDRAELIAGAARVSQAFGRRATAGDSIGRVHAQPVTA